MSFRDIRVDLTRREATLKGAKLNLTSVELNILTVMMRAPGKVFNRAELIEKAMGQDFDGFDRVIDVHVFNLRQKLEPDPKRPKYIKTVYGIGYKLADE
jgi:DNA-binding response OmpR family regulator